MGNSYSILGWILEEDLEAALGRIDLVSDEITTRFVNTMSEADYIWYGVVTEPNSSPNTDRYSIRIYNNEIKNGKIAFTIDIEDLSVKFIRSSDEIYRITGAICNVLRPLIAISVNLTYLSQILSSPSTSMAASFCTGILYISNNVIFNDYILEEHGLYRKLDFEYGSILSGPFGAGNEVVYNFEDGNGKEHNDDVLRALLSELNTKSLILVKRLIMDSLIFDM